MSPSDRSHLKKYCLHDLRVLRVGTACSGTDGPLLCWRAFADTHRADLGESFVVSHELSSEKEKCKQDFIMKAFPQTPAIFEDCCDLPCDTAMDVLSRQQKPVSTDLDTFAAGFTCTDASPLSADSLTLENRSCMLQGGLRTGSVFWALRAYLLKCIRYSPGKRDWLCGKRAGFGDAAHLQNDGSSSWSIEFGGCGAFDDGGSFL